MKTTNLASGGFLLAAMLVLTGAGAGSAQAPSNGELTMAELTQ